MPPNGRNIWKGWLLPGSGGGVRSQCGGYMRNCVFTVATAACCGMLLAGPLEANSSFKQEGKASWYKMGTQTANGERYDPMGITAAHPSLPFDTKVRVTNPASGKSVVVRINDRGPFTGGRIIDLSQGAAQEINLVKAGVAKHRGTGHGGPGGGGPGGDCRRGNRAATGRRRSPAGHG